MSDAIIVIALAVGAFVVANFVGEWLTIDKFDSRGEGGNEHG